MGRLVRSVVLVGLLAVATGCTDAQKAWVAERIAQITQEKDPLVQAQEISTLKTIVDAYTGYVDSVAEGHPCPQWAEMAMAAGFTAAQWEEPVSRIMMRESGCNPRAQNSSSSAAGLMQELSMWLDDCGGTSREDFYDPWFNLQCAYHIYLVQGWHAWVTY